VQRFPWKKCPLTFYWNVYWNVWNVFCLQTSFAPANYFLQKKEEELQTCLKCGMTEQIAEQTFVQLSAFSSISLGSNGARLLKNPSSSNPGTYGIKAAGLCKE